MAGRQTQAADGDRPWVDPRGDRHRARITLWQYLHLYNYGVYWQLIALTVGAGLIAIVSFGSLTGSLLSFALQRLGFDPASASAPFVATLVDVTGLVIYFSVALLILSGTVL